MNPKQSPSQKPEVLQICEHEWVYENKILCSYPGQQNRICRKCGKKETMTLGIMPYPENEYEDLVRKFKPKMVSAGKDK